MGTVSTTIHPGLTRSTALRQVLQRLGDYWALLKSLQTGLLLATAVAGYVSGCCLNTSAGSLAMLVGSLFLAVGGSTVLNMAFDRDIDAKMHRTACRPLPAGRLSAVEAWTLGALLTTAGLLWAAAVDVRYAAVVASGVILDVLVYTIWLKRRTPFSILIGGLSGGMPVLAGRVLATGKIDEIGLLLAVGVLLWIPTHIMTFSIKYQSDYAQAGIPTFPSTYGVPATRVVIGISTFLAVVVLFSAGWLIALPTSLLQISGVIGLALLVLVVFSLARPGKVINFVLYKGASIYMLLSMLLMIMGGI
jgi:protoheme IX farnesyltransferase